MYVLDTLFEFISFTDFLKRKLRNKLLMKLLMPRLVVVQKLTLSMKKRQLKVVTGFMIGLKCYLSRRKFYSRT